MQKIKGQRILLSFSCRKNGYILRARAIPAESNEKIASYFATLEKHKSGKKETISKIKVNDSFI